METTDKLYRILKSSWSSNGRAPSLRELQVRTGRDLPALREALLELRAGGYVEWEPAGGAESIRLTSKVRRDEFREERSGGGIEYWTDH